MSILYIAPFFEKSQIGISATYNAKFWSKHFNITCRPIGEKQLKNDFVKNNMKALDKYDYFVIHSNPENFVWKSGFKKVIGITHIKSSLIQETNFYNFFNIMDEVYHDSSFNITGIDNIKPIVDNSEYVIKERNKAENYRFLIHGSPYAYEEVLSVIRAFNEEFRQEEPVELIIKMPENYNVQTFMENLDALHSTGRKYVNKAYPNVGFLNNWMEKQELLNFYQDFDCILNCSLYNIYSRPIIDCLLLDKRCISLIDEVRGQVKMAVGPSEHKDYPVGVSPTLAMPEVREILRKAYNGSIDNRLKKEDFSEEAALTQTMAIFK